MTSISQMNLSEGRVPASELDELAEQARLAIPQVLCDGAAGAGLRFVDVDVEGGDVVAWFIADDLDAERFESAFDLIYAAVVPRVDVLTRHFDEDFEAAKQEARWGRWLAEQDTPVRSAMRRAAEDAMRMVPVVLLTQFFTPTGFLSWLSLFILVAVVTVCPVLVSSMRGRLRARPAPSNALADWVERGFARGHDRIDAYFARRRLAALRAG